MPEVAFIVPRLAPPATELVDTLRDELELQGVPSTVAEKFPAPRPELVYVLVEPRAYVGQHGLVAVPQDAVLGRTIVLVDERPDARADDEYLALLRAAGAVFTLDDRAVAQMGRRGIAARSLPPGYSRTRDHFDAAAQRPIDILFLGLGTPRQTHLLSTIAPRLERRNCLLRLVGRHGDAHAILGEDRWSLLSGAKIMLNLHADEDTRFETQHAFDAIHAGAVVVSEHASGIGALQPGRDLLVGDGRSLPFLIDTLLEDEERLRRMRADAYERLRGWLPFALSASVFRAAVVELLGAPVPDGLSFDRRTAGRHGAVDSGPRTPDSALARRLETAQLEVLTLRGELAAARRETARLSRPAGDDHRIELAHRSPAWNARRRPRVTVVTAALDGDDDVTATLDSVARSQFDDWELVVVAASATDALLRTVQGWVRSQPRIAATVLAHRTAIGRGTARNTGVDFARGELLLVADPGTTVRAACLGRLVEVLTSTPGMTFAYPMVGVLGDRAGFVQGGGDHLLNTSDWDPGLVRRGNPVHAPYLIRTRALRALGGFASDAVLADFEDHDLWARLAEHGGAGQLLAQVQAAWLERPGRSALTSMALTDGPVVRALQSRAPRLLAGAFTAAAA